MHAVPGSDVPPDQRTDWWAIGRLVAVVLAVVVAAQMFARLEDVIGLVLLAATIALLTAPVVRRLGPRIGDGLAIALTALATLAVAAVIGVLLFRDLAAQIDRLSGELVDRLDDLEPGSFPARLASAAGAERGVERVLERVPPILLVGEEDVAGIGRRIVDTFVVVILAAFFQSGAPAAVDWLASHWSRGQRRDVRGLIADIEGRGVGYARRSLLLGTGVALVIGVTCALVGLPGQVVLATWAGVWSLVPVIGWAIGLLPVLVAAIIDGPLPAVVLTVVSAAVVTTVTIRRRALERRTLRLGVTPSALAIALGASMAGLGGALVAFVAVAMISAALTTTREVPRADEPPPVSIDPLLRATDHGIVIAPGWRGVLTVTFATAAGLLLWMLGNRIGPAVIWVVVACLVAVALDRPAAWLMRRGHLRRGAAVAVLVVAGATVGVAAAWAGVSGGAGTSTALTDELPRVVADLEDAPVIGRWLADAEAAVWLEDQMSDLPQRVGETGDVSEWLPSAGARLLDLFWTVLLVIAFLLDGNRVVHAVEQRVPARHRRQVQRATSVSYRALAGYAGGAALVAGINASVVLVLALALGVALAPVLAVWAFIWNFVPQIGGFMGGLPLVVFALAVGPLRALAAALLFLLYQLIENHLIQPTVIGEAIDVPPWATLLAALAGGAAAGVVGAVILTPLVGVVRLLLTEVRRGDFPGQTVPAPSARLTG